jgi:hypothetical protein
MRTVLVGNGGSLLRHNHGSLIDSYDRVVRLNRCKIKGYEQYVGTRTDLWLVSIHGGLGRFKWPNASPQPPTMLTYSLTSYEEILTTLHDQLDPTMELMPLANAIEVAKFVGGHYPSNGLTAAIMLKPCAIAGFDHWSDERNHYGDDLPSPRSHCAEREREFFTRLEQLGHVTRL